MKNALARTVSRPRQVLSLLERSVQVLQSVEDSRGEATSVYLQAASAQVAIRT